MTYQDLIDKYEKNFGDYDNHLLSVCLPDTKQPTFKRFLSEIGEYEFSIDFSVKSPYDGEPFRFFQVTTLNDGIEETKIWLVSSDWQVLHDYNNQVLMSSRAVPFF